MFSCLERVLSCLVLSCLISGASVFHAKISLWDLAQKVLTKRKNTKFDHPPEPTST